MLALEQRANMKKLSIFMVGVTFLTFSTNIFSQTLIVSDIDDTIKNANIRGKYRRVIRAFATKPVFKGMAPLYHEMVNNIKDAKLIYLTNAPKKLMTKSHTKFLKRHGFPKAPVLFRVGDSETFKPQTLRKLMAEHSPKRVILIGDNGENDSRFYQDLKRDFPSVDFQIFIRVAYPANDETGPKYAQHGFVTPVEVALDLYRTGHFNFSTAQRIVRAQSFNIVFEEKRRARSSQYFPKWMNCKDHKLSSDGREFNENIISWLRKRIKAQCEGKDFKPMFL